MQATLTKPQSQRAEVTFCAIDRVGAHAFLVVCTTLSWQVYRLDKFSATRDTFTPVQLVLDDSRDGALLSNVRMLRLFEVPSQDASTSDRAKAPSVQLAGLFVSERCNEVDYTHRSASAREACESHTENTTEGSEDLTVFSFTDERILKRLPPTPSSVVDLQMQRTYAAVLCESHEILVVDLLNFTIQQRISSLTSLAVALGPRWIAYPGSPSIGFDDDSDSDDGEEVVPEALVSGGSHQLLHSGNASDGSSATHAYTAIDVAQNVASGIYYLSKTIAPYLSSSPGPHADASNGSLSGSLSRASAVPIHSASTSSSTFGSSAPTSTSTPSAAHAGWVVVQDLRTGRVVATFKCHATALVHLAFDCSGSLLATSSTKGQNVHVYRLLPPLQGQRRPRGHSGHNGGVHTHPHRADRHQLLYKLQRGITHASIADMAFSQDSKWINVTSAHGTSHLYAIHPDGASIGLDSHATVVQSTTAGDGGHGHSSGHSDAVSGRGLRPGRDVSDFCASLRAIEPKTVARVLKIYHAYASTPSSAAAGGSASSTATALGVSSSSYYSSPPFGGASLVGSALDASQALFSQLAQSTTQSLPRVDFGLDEAADLAARRRHRRRRLSCLFAHDGLKMAICCDGTLKLYDLSVHASRSAASARGSAIHPTSLLSKTRSSTFGFDATVTELKTWELLDTPRLRTESLSSGDESADASAAQSTAPMRGRSEMRTFTQLGLPLWAHPKISFRVTDAEHPEGTLLQVKRTGPSNDFGADGLVHGDEQHLFVLEMDSYFGLGGSPVFTGQPDQRVTPEVPGLDLAESINLAMSTSLKTPFTDNKTSPELTEDADGPVILESGRKKKKRSGKSTGSSASSASTSTSSSPSMLQFTFQDMYFATPHGEEQ